MKKALKIIVGIIIIAIAFVVGGFVGKQIYGNNNSNSSNNTASTSDNHPAAATSELTTVLASPQKYFGKYVTVNGSIYSVGSDYYLVQPVASPSKDTANSILLDFSQTEIDPSRYANAGSSTQTEATSKAPTKLKPAVTITGQITENSSKNQVSLVVSALKAQ